MWYQIEFPKEVALNSIQLNNPPISRGWRKDAPPPLQTYPRFYELLVSKDGQNWITLDKGEGTDQDFTLDFNPIVIGYLKFKLTGTVKEEDVIPWRMRQLKLFELKKEMNLSK